MNQWSNSARKKLEDYFARARTTIQASGADVNEVIEDLRRHVDEEIARLKLAVVTEQDVGHILTRIGAPEAPAVARRFQIALEHARSRHLGRNDHFVSDRAGQRDDSAPYRA